MLTTWWMRVGTVVMLGGIVGGWIAPPTATAHEPTEGGSTYGLTAEQVIVYTWGSGVPTWVKNVYSDSLKVHWPHGNTNNSKAPTFSGPSSGGTAVMHFSLSGTSPCSGSTQWIACAKNWGKTTLKIYVRDFDSAPLGSTHWWDKIQSCTGSSCHYLRRALIHEIGHAALGLGPDHSTQAEKDTVMRPQNPTYSAEGGQRKWLQRCDQARAQLLWDLLDKYGPYGDCFDHIANAGPTGLKSELTTSGTSFHACNGQSISVTGRLQAGDYSSYQKLRRNALAGRTVWFDRGSTPKYTSTTAGLGAAPADNWSKSFSGSGVSYTWTAHFDHTSKDGLSDSPTRQFTTTWSSSC